MTAATQTITDLNRAIRRFGTYQLQDKGAVEVMDVEAIQTRLRTAGIEDTIHTLEALRQHKHGAPLIRHLIMVFVEDEEWPELTTALTATPELREAYVPWLNEEQA